MRTFGSIQPILSYVRRAVDTYSMIDDGEKIAVGVSGGKDSITLLCALKALSKFYPKKFDLHAIYIDGGFPEGNSAAVERICEETETELLTVKTDIYDIVFNYREEKSPCSLCARLRRGALHDAALSVGCKKIALGHHFDDAVETFMLNLFNEGRIGCFAPVTFLDRKGVTLIRPMLYLPENMVSGFVNKEQLMLSGKCCPVDGHTDREKMKQLLHTLEIEDRGLKQRIFGAMVRSNISGF